MTNIISYLLVNFTPFFCVSMILYFELLRRAFSSLQVTLKWCPNCEFVSSLILLPASKPFRWKQRKRNQLHYHKSCILCYSCSLALSSHDLASLTWPNWVDLLWFCTAVRNTQTKHKYIMDLFSALTLKCSQTAYSNQALNYCYGFSRNVKNGRTVCIAAVSTAPLLLWAFY